MARQSPLQGSTEIIIGLMSVWLKISILINGKGPMNKWSLKLTFDLKIHNKKINLAL